VVRGVGNSQKSTGNHRHHHRRYHSRAASAVQQVNKSSKNEEAKKPHKKKRRGFEYDYKEVFLKSNVPQLIATLSGRVIVCE
jgi:hypothetical protein